MKPSQIVVRTPGKHYAVVCAQGALRNAGRRIGDLGRTTGVFVLSSPRVWRHWGAALQQSLRVAGPTRVILFDDAEAAKNLATIEKLCRALSRAVADRTALIVAVGGGVVGDVAGFVAASYLRGVRLVHVPTTLVGQVDSAIGGKTGVNLPEGKNLVGAFYQPDLVLCDPGTLKTLPDRDYRSGLYEVMKYGVIGDAQLFELLEKNLEQLLRRDATTLERVITTCITQKAKIAAADERESGLREILNFGHTFGHALESITRYRVYRHGEAVGWGMIAASLLAVATDHLTPQAAARIISLVIRIGPLPRLPGVSDRQIVASMRSDKKSRAGRLRFVLPRKIGRAEWGVEVPDDLVGAVWRELLGAERSNAGRHASF